MFRQGNGGPSFVVSFFDLPKRVDLRKSLCSMRSVDAAFCDILMSVHFTFIMRFIIVNGFSGGQFPLTNSDVNISSLLRLVQRNVLRYTQILNAFVCLLTNVTSFATTIVLVFRTFSMISYNQVTNV